MLTTTAQVRAALLALPRSHWVALAAESGVPRSTIEKIAYGVTQSPSFDATVGLVRALERRRGSDDDDADNEATPEQAGA